MFYERFGVDKRLTKPKTGLYSVLCCGTWLSQQPTNCMSTQGHWNVCSVNPEFCQPTCFFAINNDKEGVEPIQFYSILQCRQHGGLQGDLCMCCVSVAELLGEKRAKAGPLAAGQANIQNTNAGRERERAGEGHGWALYCRAVIHSLVNTGENPSSNYTDRSRLEEPGGRSGKRDVEPEEAGVSSLADISSIGLVGDTRISRWTVNWIQLVTTHSHRDSRMTPLLRLTFKPKGYLSNMSF